MTRRLQKLGKRKSRTAWLTWCAWAVLGTSLVFDDVMAGTGMLPLMLTAPFWLLFFVWPFLWGWLQIRARDPSWVDLDEDIAAGDITARVVLKNGVLYVDADEIFTQFQYLPSAPFVSIAGGTERFAVFESLLEPAQHNARLQQWTAAVRQRLG